MDRTDDDSLPPAAPDAGDESDRSEDAAAGAERGAGAARRPTNDVDDDVDDDADDDDDDAAAAADAGAGAGGGGASGKGGAVFPTTIVLPGQDVTALLTRVAGETTLRLGAGLVQDGARVVGTTTGVLRFRAPARFWVQGQLRRYRPAAGDAIVARVVSKSADSYRTDFGGSAAGLLPVLAFDGASKRNKPDLAVGALVYCRVAVVDRHLEPELSCQVVSGPKKDWMTGEALFGELNGGTIVEVSPSYARRLLAPDHPLLEALGRTVPFEIAVGVNGVVWLRTASVSDTILVSNAVRNGEFLSPAEQRALVRRTLSVRG